MRIPHNQINLELRSLGLNSSGYFVLAAVCVTVLVFALGAWRSRRAATHASKSSGARIIVWQENAPVRVQQAEQGAERSKRELINTTLWTCGAIVIVLIRVLWLHCAVSESGITDAASQALFVTTKAQVISESKELKSQYGDDSQFWYLAQIERLHMNGKTTTYPAQLRIVSKGSPKEGPVFGSVVSIQGTLSRPDPSVRTIATLRTSGTTETVREPWFVARLTNHLRAELNILVSHLSPQTRGLVPGAAIGDTRQLSPELSEAMKISGLTHITAVSGSHFAIIFLLTQWATARLHVRIRAGIIAVACTGFVFLVHPSGSVLRALVMGLVAVWGLTKRRRSQGLAALAAASIVLLILDPFQASDYGFVLSVLATAGLIVGSGPIARFLHRPRRESVFIPKGISEIIAVPVAAQLAVGPVLLLLQPYISVYSVPANILAAPALAPATVFGLVATLLAPWASSLAIVFAHLSSAATWWIAWVAMTFAHLPGSKLLWWEGELGLVTLACLTALMCCSAWLWNAEGHAYNSRLIRSIGRLVQRVFTYPYYRLHVGGATKASENSRYPKMLRWKDPLRYRLAGLPLTRAIVRSRRRIRRFSLIGTALLMVAVLFALQPVWLRTVLGPATGSAGKHWMVWACDVGQGDGFLARGNDNQIYMFDVGQDEYQVLDCLAKAGVERISILFISHYHTDHYGALEAVLGAVRVDEIVAGPLVERSLGATYVLGAAQKFKVPIYSAGSERTVDRFNAQGSLPDAEEPLDSKHSDSPWNLVWPTAQEAAFLAESTARGEEHTNDLSMVVAVNLQDGYRAIFLGDLEEEGQTRFANYLAKREGSASYDIVKMAHHGSSSQSEKLAAILAPSVTLIGVGQDNSYGHPTSRALDMYGGQGSAILRTDLCGAFGVYARTERWFVVGDCP